MLRRPRSAWRPILLLAVLVCAAGADGEPAPSCPEYEHLRGALPDGRRIELATPLGLRRDVFRFHFASGAFHLLPPLGGRQFGAVFLGEGRFEFLPATADEREHLALVHGKKTMDRLERPFDRLVLMFTDGTAGELLASGPPTEGDPDPRAVAAIEATVKKQRKRFKTNFHQRLLQDLLAAEPYGGGVFIALFDARGMDPAVAAVDPLGADALRLTSGLGAEEVVLYVPPDPRDFYPGDQVWYSNHRKSELESGRYRDCRPRRLLDAEHYEVHTRTELDGNEFAGQTTVRFQPLVAGQRVVPLHLMPTLRVQSAKWLRDGAEIPLAVLQEAREDDPDVAIVFPEPLPPAQAAEVRLAYSRDPAGRRIVYDVYKMGARSTWYPNLGAFDDRATFDLHFDVPRRETLVAVGRRVEELEDGRRKRSRWRADFPATVAGFNLGRFEDRIERQDEHSGVAIEVHSHRGFTQEENVLVDGLNSVRLFSQAFGALPFDRITLSPQTAFFAGQAWPTLVYMPGSSYLNTTVFGLSGWDVTEFRDTVGPHEVAHQWWGHLIGWENYRDQWLSEGFATFSALYLIQQSVGWDRHDKILRKAREIIQDEYKDGRPGPITRGWRLATSRTPAAYGRLIYDKGGFVLHMLRMAMRDPRAAEPDGRFLAMMRDFVTSHRDGNPSTHDFQRVAERHIVPQLDPQGDGTLDWFFDQWVYGTEIPTLDAELTAERVAPGRYRISGTLVQGGVSDDFVTAVPLYADFGKDGLRMIGRVPLKGAMTRRVQAELELPRAPKRIVANAHEDVLTLRR